MAFLDVVFCMTIF